MPLKVNTEASMMDIFAIALAAIAGLNMVFSYGPAIDMNTQLIQNGLNASTTQVNHLKTEIIRVEKDSDKAVDELKDSIEKVGESVEEVRKEGANDRKDIIGKIDKLILRN